MKYLYITLITFILIKPPVFAQSTILKSDIVISEVQLGSATSASDEYVEVANRSVEPSDLTGYKLQYKSKNGSSWITKATLSGYIAPYGRYLLATNINPSSQPMNSGLSATGGHLRIVDTNQVQLDMLGWGQASQPDGVAITSHDNGQSLKRKLDEDGRFIDTDNNYDDWFISDNPTPEFDVWQAPSISLPPSVPSDPIASPITPTIVETPPLVDPFPVVEPLPEVQPQPQPDSKLPQKPLQPTYPKPNTKVLPLTITELMPDPVSPLKDSEAEFIELYNPNDTTVDLSDYQLESGTNWRYKYQIPQFFLKPGRYLAIYSQDSKLTLSNAGSSVRLIGATGSEITKETYPKAKPGLSWSNIAGEWGWSTPSPNAVNNKVVINSQKTIPKTSDAEKVLGALTIKDINYPSSEAKTSEKVDKTTTQDTSQYKKETTEPTKVNNAVLAVIAVLAVSYAVYEYRNELRIRLQQLQRYFSLRRKTWPKLKGWGGDRIAQRYRRWQNYFSSWYSQRRR